MISIAQLLDSAKASAKIESDYRLAKVIGITHSAVSNYRAHKTMPDARVLEQLCALSGDDVAVVMAQIQAQRERTPEGKTMWLKVAARLQAGAVTAILSVCMAMLLIAGSASDARAATVQAYYADKVDLLYIVSTTFLSVGQFLYVRLRSLRTQMPLLLRLCGSAWA